MLLFPLNLTTVVFSVDIVTVADFISRADSQSRQNLPGKEEVTQHTSHPKVCKYYNPQIKTAWIENTFYCVLYALYTIIVVIIIIDNLAKILWFIYQWDSELFSFFFIVVIVLLNINIEIFVFTYILYLLL